MSRDSLQAAIKALRDGNYREALQQADLYTDFLPDDAAGQVVRAQALVRLQRRSEAADALKMALALRPGLVPALLLSAELAFAERDAARAVVLLQNVLDQQPDHAAAWLGLARAQAANGELEAGLSASNRAVILAPEASEAWRLRGRMAIQLGRSEIAEEAFAALLALQPDDAGAAHGYVTALKGSGASAERILAARESAANLIGTAAAWTGLGHEALSLGRNEEARQALKQALELDPDYLPARFGCLAFPATPVFESELGEDEYLTDFRDGLDWFESTDPALAPEQDRLSAVTLATPFYLHYLDRETAAEQRRYARVVETMTATDTGETGPTEPVLAPLRVAFVSASLCRHTITKLFGAFITGLETSRFEGHLFQVSNRNDSETGRLASAAASLTVGERPVAQWVEAITACQPDILVYLDIGMHPVVQALACRRLAPRQLMLWGHPVSSRFLAIDGFITADAMEREGGEADYDEALYRLPRLGACVTPPDRTPRPPAELVENTERIECFVAQSAPKLLPVHDGLWSRIARAVPGARFHFTPSPHAPTVAQLRRRMERAFDTAGLSLDEHLGLMRFVTEEEFLGTASRVDINLDTPLWSGGNSSLEILWFDVPTVTLPGPAMRSRHTAAMLELMDLDELVAGDRDDYVRIVTALAESKDYRDDIRGRIRERKHRLYDDHGTVEAFMDLLESQAGRI